MEYSLTISSKIEIESVLRLNPYSNGILSDWHD